MKDKAIEIISFLIVWFVIVASAGTFFSVDATGMSEDEKSAYSEGYYRR